MVLSLFNDIRVLPETMLSPCQDIYHWGLLSIVVTLPLLLHPSHTNRQTDEAINLTDYTAKLKHAEDTCTMF